MPLIFWLALVKYVKKYARYVTMIVLTANTFRLLFTYNTSYIRDLISLWNVWTFTESVIIFP